MERAFVIAVCAELCSVDCAMGDGGNDFRSSSSTGVSATIKSERKSE